MRKLLGDCVLNLLTLAKNGDNAAKEQLFNNAVKPCRYIIGLLQNDASAADKLCLEAFCRAFSSLERLDDDEDFTVWMKNLAFVAACAACRKADGAAFDTEKVTCDDMPYTAEEIFKKGKAKPEKLAARADECVKKMPLALRAATVCVYYNGNSAEQLARIIGSSLENAEKFCSAAEAALLNALCAEETELTECDIAEFLDMSAEKLKCDFTPFEAKNVEHEQSAEPIENEKKHHFKLLPFIIAAVAAVLIAAGVLAAVLPAIVSSSEGSSVSSVTASSAPTDAVSVASAVSGLSSVAASSAKNESKAAASATASAVKAEKIPKLPLYVFTLTTVSDAEGRVLRSQVHTYKNGVPAAVKTKTQVILQELYYNYSKNGRYCETKDENGEICAKTVYDGNGFPTKVTFKDGKSVKYTMKYTVNESGLIKTAAYKSENSGKYSISYKDGRVAKITHTVGDKTEAEQRIYDESGALVKCIKQNFAGAETEYVYNYDTENMTYTCSVSDGTVINGKMQLAQSSDNYIYNGVTSGF